MRQGQQGLKRLAFGIAVVTGVFGSGGGFSADHNDPNAINAIFSDHPPSGADLYDLFGFPGDDTAGGEKVVIALTFGAIPATGVFDSTLMYRIHVDPDPRLGAQTEGDFAAWRFLKGAYKKYFEQKPAEVRVSFNGQRQAKVDFLDFPGGDFSQVIDTNRVVDLSPPSGGTIKTFVGGRDDAFFNDLPGFFRSINYGPQYYLIPEAMAQDKREFPIPKTLIELEGNTLFNYDPKQPQWGISDKRELPAGSDTGWSGRGYLKDADGNYRFVYSGQDAQRGMNVNAIILELPMSYISADPDRERIVRTWGESWRLSAEARAGQSGDPAGFDDDPQHYGLVDVDGVPFLDAALNEREDDRQKAYNLGLSLHYVKRFAHLGWGFGPSIAALGLKSCFDHGDVAVSVHQTYDWTLPAFYRAKHCLFQRINMPDDSWNPGGLDIEPPRTFEIFIPNVASIDMDTNGTWPFGRRLEDQVATRFLSLFLDMENGCGGKCTVESLGNQALWDSAPIEPKTPPNPLRNDKPFLDEFPYLAEPW